MNQDDKKTALRMIPYGLYVLTAESEEGKVAAAGVSWVTQASFKPPLVVVAVKVDSFIHILIKETKAFALNILGKGQNDLAYAFFKHAERQGQTIGGQPFYTGKTGSPILENTPAFVECLLVDAVEKGDHSVFVGEVVAAGIQQQPAGRPDQSTLWLLDLGENIFYGG